MNVFNYSIMNFRILIHAFIFITTFASEAQVVIQRCDNQTGWIGEFDFSIDNSDKKEGFASLSIEAQTGNYPWFSRSFSQTQTGIDAEGYLSFWLYISDTDKMEGGQIEISSSGLPDSLEFNWPLNKDHIQNGWNHLNLKISEANKTGGEANPDGINFFRIYQEVSAPVTAKLDFVRFTSSLENPSWPLLDVKKVDNTSLDGKVMFGYQGWFNHPDDGAGLGWIHWGNFYEPISSTVDMYPDMREYGLNEKYRTDLTLPDGRMAPVFSSHNRNTVVRHMKWIRDYNLDGVFLQRFISAANDNNKMNHKDTVAVHVIEGSEKYGRVFSIMYDGIGNRVDDIKEDWKHLVDDMAVTNSESYLNHRGLPLVALWGYTVRDEATVDQLEELIDFFKNNPEPRYRASLLLGVAWNWYDQSERWLDAFKNIEVISPWFSGSTNYDKGQHWCDQNNVDFLPVVHPGFSWHNLKGDPKNASPREGGNFLWDEVNHVLSKNAKSVYIAMFDEVDEGTAMFKLAETSEDVPTQGYWLPLDEDGYKLPGDWYLRNASLITRVVRGYEDNLRDLVSPPEGIMTIRITDEVNKNVQGAMEFLFPDFPDHSGIEISIDSGYNYNYYTLDDAKTYTIADLEEGNYYVFVRHNASSPAVDMGEVYIGNAIELPPSQVSNPYPANNEGNVRRDLTLGWDEGEYVQSHTIYFGKTSSPDSVANQASPFYNPGELEPNTTYFWKVDEVNAFGLTEGPLWSFTTSDSEARKDIMVLDYCDSKAGWNSHNNLEIDNEEKKEGYSALMSEGSGTVWFRKNLEHPLNTYCDSSSYLNLWLFVSDTSKFGDGGQIEVTSSGGPDKDEYSWPMESVNLVNGWNELQLKISSAQKIGDPDLEAINFMRIYQFVSESIITRLDFVRFSGLLTIPLAIPSNFIATAGDGSVFLDWDDNNEGNLAGYNVYRTNLSGLAYKKQNDNPITDSEFRDINVSNGVYYYYVLTAMDTLGFESEYTKEVLASPSPATSVTETPESTISIYPNPATGRIYLDTQQDADVFVYNFYGKQLIHKENVKELDIENLPKGYYIVKLLRSNKSYVHKLIVK